MTTLAELTTLGVGGPAHELTIADSEAALVEQVRDADARGIPLLVLGGGSNLLVGDDGFDGRVVCVRSTGVRVDDSGCGGVWVNVAAGENWCALVDRAVDEGWIGIEALAGIPGSVGATPLQNVGAYGQEVASTIARVRSFDRVRGEVVVHAVGDCGFGYRTSRFRAERVGESSRYVVLGVEFQFPAGTLSAPIAYVELARSLGVAVGTRVPMAEVREAVLALRRSKGMVLDPSDPDTRSAGSFFINPIVPADFPLPDVAPRWPVECGAKVSAAWLIERAGFARGFALPGSRAALSSKHTLAITNRGGATAAELLELAESIQSGVYSAFGIMLHREPRVVGTL